MKKLFIAYYYTNGENIGEKAVFSDTLQNAREKAKAYKIANACDTIRAYESFVDKNGNIIPETLQKIALFIAKKSAEKAIDRTGGNATQTRICDNLKKATAMVLNYERVTLDNVGYKIFTFTAYRENKNGETIPVKTGNIIAQTAETAKEKAFASIPQKSFDTLEISEKTLADELHAALSELCPDSAEYVGQAETALFESHKNGMTLNECYHNAYLAINKHIMQLRTATQKECSTEYITENNGEIVSIGSYYGKILKGKAEYIPTETATADNIENEKALFETLQNCGLTPRQLKIVLLSIRGYSQRQIAKKMGVKSVGTIGEHFVSIRKKATAYLLENYPEIAQKIK